MTRRTVVSTECPTCAAPLDFSEGSNAVRCLHCRSNLLVTGRKQVLSYFIAPRIEAEKARAQTALALRRARREPRSLQPRLYFVPYYRFTGQDFIWAHPSPEPVKLPVTYDESGSSAGRVLEWGPWSTGSLVDLADSLWSVKDEASIAVRPVKKQSDAPLHLQFRGTKYHDDIEFDDHHVEKNFVAADLGEAALYSIGVRSAVLKLQLFEQKKVESIGRVVRIDVDVDAALRRALMIDRDRVVFHETVGTRLSLVYFPYWIVQADTSGEAFLVVVDGVSGGVITTDVPLALYAALNSGGTLSGDVASFRPLVCPNCGWDFPVRPEDTIFYCRSCERTWLLEGKELHRVPHQIASAEPAVRKKPVVHKYFPFWVAEVKPRDGDGKRYIVPAFRYRQLKHVQMLATRLARTPRDYERVKDPAGEMTGGFYDADDARKLARFTYAGISAAEGKRIDVDLEVNVSRPELVWFPFRSQGNYLFDPWFGANLFATLLK